MPPKLVGVLKLPFYDTLVLDSLLIALLQFILWNQCFKPCSWDSFVSLLIPPRIWDHSRAIFKTNELILNNKLLSQKSLLLWTDTAFILLNTKPNHSETIIIVGEDVKFTLKKPLDNLFNPTVDFTCCNQQARCIYKYNGRI